MNVSFQGMDELVLTFKAAGGLEKGDFVKVTDNGTVGPCAGGDAPLGVALNVRNGFAAVQVRGFVEAEYTGTLALGGFISSSALIMRMPLFIPIVGFIYMIEVISVMIQVGYFKKTHGKRFFRMAPIHHHFEKGGWSETRVDAVFTIVTVILSLAAWLGLG